MFGLKNKNKTKKGNGKSRTKHLYKPLNEGGELAPVEAGNKEDNTTCNKTATEKADRLISNVRTEAAIGERSKEVATTDVILLPALVETLVIDGNAAEESDDETKRLDDTGTVIKEETDDMKCRPSNLVEVKDTVIVAEESNGQENVSNNDRENATNQNVGLELLVLELECFSTKENVSLLDPCVHKSNIENERLENANPSRKIRKKKRGKHDDSNTGLKKEKARSKTKARLKKTGIRVWRACKVGWKYFKRGMILYAQQNPIPTINPAMESLYNKYNKATQKRREL